MRRRRGRGDAASVRSLESVRLALESVRAATDLTSVFDQVCVGVTRVTGARNVVLAFERDDRLEVVATIGRLGEPAAYELLRRLQLSGALDEGARAPADQLVARLCTEVGNGILVADGTATLPPRPSTCSPRRQPP